MSEEYLALIPAAGIGSRAQLKTAKQFSKIGDNVITNFNGLFNSNILELI